jgi:hypothetical protein
MNANLTEIGMREVSSDEQRAIDGGTKFRIQDLISRYFQDETTEPQVQISLIHEPTAQRA